MEGAANGLAVLNSASNNFDRAICFDAPVAMDTGLFAYESKTLAQIRSELIAALGFLDPLTYTRTRTLAEIRAEVARALGWAAQVAAGSYPQGSSNMLDDKINLAIQTIFSRLELDNGAVSAPARLVNDADVIGMDYVPALNLAIGLAKAQYGQPDAKIYMQMADVYVTDVARRRPPMLTSTLNAMVRSAQEQMYFRYSMLRTERWWAWQTTAGRQFYDVPIDCTKFLDFRKITGAWISDNGGRALIAWNYQTVLTLGQFYVPQVPNGFEYEVTLAGTGGPVDLITGLPSVPTWQLVAGQSLNLGGGTGATITARVASTARWLPLRQGIDAGIYNVTGHTMPYRFELREYLEIWPIPDKTYIIWLRGHLGLKKLDVDADTLTIDFQPVFLHALAAAKEQFKQMGAGTIRRDLEILLGRYTAAAHGVKRYIPNPRDNRVIEGWAVNPDLPAQLPIATFR